MSFQVLPGTSSADSYLTAAPVAQPSGAQAEAVELSRPLPAERGPDALPLLPIPGPRHRLHRRGTAPGLPNLKAVTRVLAVRKGLDSSRAWNTYALMLANGRLNVMDSSAELP